ncbi:hypothetical protein [Adhaeribacter pallidiroseus]|uniref:Uncharacterized protein n=1 Tax=Adhaeribacter pallidiroseus TaxID=2072847 RepID=A0A369QLY8_9BACT|nr:hypothetical protein [Adhaeribacter pallidiroseus]RDC65734.1 hypothetical protein AHMF7616_04364 [Adhaeribacter pallidiroseus]
MPYKSNNTNQQSKENTGDPTGMGKGNLTDINAEESLEITDELSEKYTDENGDPDLPTTPGSHPNRNTNKPSIDKPSYG